MPDSLPPHGLQHSRLSCPSLLPEVYSDSCPSSWWSYLTISSSAASLSFCVQAFPASGSFPMSWLFTSGDQSVGVPAKWFNFCNDTRAAATAHKRGREELPHARDQGQKPGGPHAQGRGWLRVPGCDGTRTAKRSYPMSKVRGGGWECQAATALEPRGATPGPRPGVAAGRSNPTS